MEAEVAMVWGWATDTVDKPAELSAMRRSLRSWLDRLDIHDDCDALLLVANELTTNAIEASTAPTDPVALRVGIEGDQLVVAAANVGPSFVLPSTFPGDPTAASGRGLVIVQSLTDKMQVRRDGRYVVVSARLWLGSAS